MNTEKTLALFDLGKSLAGDFLSRYEYPWEALPHIKAFILELGANLPASDYTCLSESVWVAKDVTIAPTASIAGPTVIGPGTEIRPGAFIRGSVLIGAGCVVGNSTEMKNAIIFDNVQIPHFNYVGDSILGYKAHMGAGAVTSNVKGDRTPVIVRGAESFIETGLKKFGAMLGDHAEVGCNAVLNPGTVVGRNSQIYPCSCVRGVVPPDSIYKNNGEIIRKNERT